MKNYTITVNGSVYDVVVEERMAGAAPAPVAPAPAPVAPAPAPVAPAPAPAAPAPAPVAPAPAPAPAPAGSAGSIEITSPMPGKILGAKASVGQAVKRGDVILLLEAMKMENEIVATEDGVVASINVNTGDMVEAGDVLATLN